MIGALLFPQVLFGLGAAIVTLTLFVQASEPGRLLMDVPMVRLLGVITVVGWWMASFGLGATTGAPIW